jgi:predicted Zn-dependent protease
MSLDSSLAEPHASLGYIDFYYYWNWDKAENEFLTAIRLNPGYPIAHDANVYLLTARERYAEASVELEKAMSLDPSSAFIQTDKGFSLYYAGHYDRAIAALKDVHIRYPAFPLSWIWLGRAYEEKKNYPESINAYQMALKKDTYEP